MYFCDIVAAGPPFSLSDLVRSPTWFQHQRFLKPRSERLKEVNPFTLHGAQCTSVDCVGVLHVVVHATLGAVWLGLQTAGSLSLVASICRLHSWDS